MSTNKLTWADLERHCTEGRLRKWLPELITRFPNGRCLYMLPEVHDAIKMRPWPGADGEPVNRTKDRRRAMRSVLERFVKGHAINYGYDIKEMGSEVVNPSMRGYWEIRSQGAMEETRAFGFFARRGAFVATGFNRRGLYPGSITWDEQRNRCRARWDFLSFEAPVIDQPWPVVTRTDLNDYLEQDDD